MLFSNSVLSVAMFTKDSSNLIELSKKFRKLHHSSKMAVLHPAHSILLFCGVDGTGKAGRDLGRAGDGTAHHQCKGKSFSAAIAFDENFNTKFVFAEHKTAEKRGNVKRYKK